MADQTENFLLLQKSQHHIMMYKTEILLLYAILRRPQLECHFQFWPPDFRIQMAQLKKDLLQQKRTEILSNLWGV